MNTPDQRSPVAQLERAATLWTIAAAASVFLGLALIAGPLAWWQGRQLRAQLQSLGADAKSATTAVWVGALATIIALLGFALLALLVVGLYFSNTY